MARRRKPPPGQRRSQRERARSRRAAGQIRCLGCPVSMMIGAEGGCMKIAFLVLNHRGPDQLVRLLKTLRAQLPESPIVVHHDIFHGDLPSETIEPIGDVHLLTSGKRMAWGDFSLVDVYSWSLKWM